MTSFSVNFAFGWFSESTNPRLPFASISATLSFSVPGKRCSGLTQDGLSHLWHISFPAGISPTNAAYDALCAFTVRLVPSLLEPIVRFPYPSEFLHPVQFQHPFSSTDIFDRILSCKLDAQTLISNLFFLAVGQPSLAVICYGHSAITAFQRRLFADPLKLDHPHPRIGVPAVEGQIGRINSFIPSNSKE